MPFCGACAHFIADAEELEREVAGLKILSSAFGSVRAETGLCRLRDFFCVPDHGCSSWHQREPILNPASRASPPAA